MKAALTPKQVATAIGVSEASVKRWCDKGLIPTLRTAGGHRRLPVGAVLEFVRQQGYALHQPEVLGVPPSTGMSQGTLDRALGVVQDALRHGDDETVRQQVLNLYLAGQSVATICDKVLARAFHALGESWHHGSLEVYQERHGCEIAVRTLHELRTRLAPLRRSAPIALGGTLCDDPYAIPTTMVEVTLRSVGWRADTYGSCHPSATLCAAIRERQPRLFWLSVSCVKCPESFLEDFDLLHQAAREHGAALVVGGRALGTDLRRRMKYCTFCDTLEHLAEFAGSLIGAPESDTVARADSA